MEDKNVASQNLLQACEDSNLDGVKKALNDGADIEERDIYGKTPLILAFEVGNKEIVELLLDRGADVEARDDISWTALHRSVFEGNTELVQLLLENGADIEARDDDYGYSALCFAITYRKNNKIIKLLLDRGADINIQDDNGKTALMYASSGNNKETVKLLLERGADINIQDDNGKTALMYASSGKNKETVKLLLERGADMEARDNNGFTALVYASSKENREIVKLLLDRGANIEAKSNDGITVLLEALANGNKEIVKLLLDNGADIKNKDKDKDIKTLLDDNHIKLLAEVEKVRWENMMIEKGGKGYLRKEERLKTWYKKYIENLQKKSLKKIKNKDLAIVLTMALKEGVKETIKLLIDNGADFNTKNENGENTLIASYMYRGIDIEIISLFLNNSGDTKNKNKEILLLKVCYNGDIAILRLFLDSGINIEARDKDKNTLLMIGCNVRNKNKVLLLIDKGANIEAKNNDGKTPLMISCEKRDKDIVSLLINKDANIEAKDNDGKTPLMISCEERDKDIISLLINKGANIEARDNDGKTVLITACEKRNKEIVALLLDRGANIEAEINTQFAFCESTPLLVAVQQEDKEIVALLLDRGANPDKTIVELLDDSKTVMEHALRLKSKEIYDLIKNHNINSYNSQRLVKILTNFRKDTPIKYTTHLWDMNFNNDYGNFDGYMARVIEQWEEIESELKDLSPNIHRKVYDFLINKSPNVSWCSKTGDDISIGWSSLEGLKEWCDRGNDPFKFELQKSYSVEDKTISTFGDVINLFKQEIQIRNENDILESIFIDIEERLDDKFDGIFEIETIKLKGKSFYTDVENLKNVLDRVFSEIEKRKKFNKIEVEMREYDDYNYMDLTITQIGSSANRTKEEMEKISNGGDMAEIKRSLRNLCDWSVEMSHDDKSYRIDYLGKIDSDTEIETRGFTHRFRFYR